MDARMVRDEDEALRREAHPMLFEEEEEEEGGEREEEEGFTRKGATRANDPRNPFFISPASDDEGPANVRQQFRLVSYPQFWNYGKMRTFAIKMVGPHLIQQKYAAIAASFPHAFCRYRRISGLDIEHRCVMIDDVGRNRKLLTTIGSPPLNKDV